LGKQNRSAPPVADALDETVIYAGPTMHRRVMVAGSVYKGGIPAHVQTLIEKVPDIGKIIVPVRDYPEARAAAKTQGTEYHRIYNTLLAVRFDGEEVRG
jgi:hypothetical protein